MAQGKLKVAVLFGGKSGEHEVSIVSATNVYKALDKNKYDVELIGIDKSGRWLNVQESHFLANSENPRLLNLNKEHNSVTFLPYKHANSLQPVDMDSDRGSRTSQNLVGYSNRFDVIFPVLHGTYGEDGTIQGLLELSQIPYVGSGVIGSAVGMDKDVARRLMIEAGIPVVPTVLLKKYEWERNPIKFVDHCIEKLKLPFFVKPANAGSSVGVHKIKSKAEAVEKITDAFRFDLKVLAEKAINARELEVAVLGYHEPKASVIGEIVPTHEFYSYEAKYIDDNGAHLHIPALGLDKKIIEDIQKIAIKTFQVLELCGMARVDFFLDKDTSQLYLNEVNTIPGFTKISMYPKLWEASGIGYSQLLDQLIAIAIQRGREREALITNYE